RLLLSALQSAVFNRALALRAAAGPLTRLRTGDVLQKTDSGGLFVTTDLDVDQPRVDRGEVVPTGPLPGGRETEPPPGTEARALEDEAIAAVGATREDFARAGRELPGARRPVIVRAQDLTLHLDPQPRLTFSLPAGAYATVLVDGILAPGV
ncbi:MAG TPA: tRNA pseudouridine(13) synthase TruD, partial [Polyangia bacterium]|nr:tRNA pseudouridine(13) synthase TruD [Polyangia bacterium]